MLSLGTSLLHLQKVINRILILYDARKYILIIGTIFVSRILQWREFTRWGWVRESGDGSPPVGSRGKGLVGVSGGLRPQKLKQNVKLVYNF